jgi:hypothetical protein
MDLDLLVEVEPSSCQGDQGVAHCDVGISQISGNVEGSTRGQ